MMVKEKNVFRLDGNERVEKLIERVLVSELRQKLKKIEDGIMWFPVFALLKRISKIVPELKRNPMRSVISKQSKFKSPDIETLQESIETPAGQRIPRDVRPTISKEIHEERPICT